MLSADAAGLPPTEALALLDYEDADRYLAAVAKERAKGEIRQQILIAEAVRHGTGAWKSKAGAKRYTSWIMDLIRKANGEDEKPIAPVKTLFDRWREEIDRGKSLLDRITEMEG